MAAAEPLIPEKNTDVARSRAQPAADAPDEQQHEVDECARDAAAVHQLAGPDEEDAMIANTSIWLNMRCGTMARYWDAHDEERNDGRRTDHVGERDAAEQVPQRHR